MSSAKVPGTESRAGKLDQVVSKLANRDAAALVTAEEAQKAHHRRRKAQVPCRIIKTTEIRSREGAVHPVDSDTDEDEDGCLVTAAEPCGDSNSRNSEDAASSRVNGVREEEAAGQFPDVLPEGTLILEPEAVNDNGPYVGPEFGTAKWRPRANLTQTGGDLRENIYKCTVCNEQLYPLNSTTVKEHPKLSVLMCQSCHKFYESGDFDRDHNGYEEQCRWCGQGGHLVCCDSCEKAFCKSCIRRNLGREHLSQVMNAGEWHCLCCDRKPLAFLVRECGQLLASIASNQGAAGAGSGDALARRSAKRSSTDSAKHSAGLKAGADSKKPSAVVNHNKKAPSVIGGNHKKVVENVDGAMKSSTAPKVAGSGDAKHRTVNLANGVDVKKAFTAGTPVDRKGASPAVAVAAAASSSAVPPVSQRKSAEGNSQAATPVSGSHPSRNASSRPLLPKSLLVVTTPNASSSPTASAPVRSAADRQQQQRSVTTSNASSSPTASAPVRSAADRQQQQRSVTTPNASSSPTASAPVRSAADRQQQQRSAATTTTTAPQAGQQQHRSASTTTATQAGQQRAAATTTTTATQAGQQQQRSAATTTTTTTATQAASFGRRGATPMVLPARPQSADSSLIVLPLGIVPRAAIRGSRTTFPELVHQLSDHMMEKIKRKLEGVHPSSDVKLLVEELLPKEVNAPSSVRRRRLYEVPWARLGFQPPPADLATGPSAAGGAVVASAVTPGGVPVGSGGVDAASSASGGKVQPSIAGRPRAPIQMVPRAASFGQQPTSCDISLAEVINQLKRRELFDAESTTNRCLHMFEQAKMNFTELRKDVHALKQAKMRHDQEAAARRQGQQPPHFERETSLHEKIKAALIDHLREVHQICTQSLRATGSELTRTTPARALSENVNRSPSTMATSAVAQSQNEEYIDVTEFEQLRRSQRGGRPAVRGSPTVLPGVSTQPAHPEQSAAATVSHGATAEAGDAALRQQSKKVSSAAIPSVSESNARSAARTSSQHSADDTDGSKSEMSVDKSEASDGGAARSTRLRQKQRSAAPSDKPSDRSEQASGDEDGKKLAAVGGGKSKAQKPAEGSENDQARLSLLNELCHMSSDDEANDGDDDNDEDTATHPKRAKQRLTPAKRNLSAISRDLRIAGQRQSAASGAGPSSSSQLGSAGKPPESARVLVNRLSDLDIARLRAELKLVGATEKQKQPLDSEPSDSPSVADKEERALVRLLRLKTATEADGKTPQHSECDDSMSGMAETSAGELKAAGPSERDRPPKKKRMKVVDKESSESKHGCFPLPSSEDTVSTESGSDTPESNADDASTARDAAAGVPRDSVVDDDCNKAALRSLLNDGLYDSSLDDAADSDSDEVTRPKAAKRRRIGSPTTDGQEEGGKSLADDGISGGCSGDDVPDESAAGGVRDKATHRLLRRRLSLGVEGNGSGSKSPASPAKAGKSDNSAAETDGDDGSTTALPPNLPDKPKMKPSRQLEDSSTDDSSRTSMDSDSDSKGGGNAAAARGAKKRGRHVSGSSNSSSAHVRSYSVRKRRRRVNAVESTDSSQSSDDDTDVKNALSSADEDDDAAQSSSLADSSQRRRRIRRLIDADRLREETKAAAKAEEERRQRILEKQKLYNQYVLEHSDAGSAGCPALIELVLDRDGDGNSIVSVDRELLAKLKSHQAEAVQFLWDCVIESVARVKSKNPAAAAGSGAILAHCMGLGKTLSVITFIHTVLNHKSLLSMHTVVVVCPLSTISNWANEWEKWQENVDNRIQVFDMSMMRKNADRAQLLLNWRRDGGVLLLGYDMYRTLVVGKRVKDKLMKETFTASLVDPGPDIIVCDEGHLLKNEATSINKSLVQARTQRRIVLTGTPLQNNLQEYFVMTDFVKPNLLGSKKEFSNRFIQPIQNGQCKDSTPTDVKLMKKRAHVLHEMLAGCVQRRDYSALTKYLPPKLEYIISVRLSKLQILLYERYLQLRGNRSSGASAASGLFVDYQTLLKIWTHPWLLHLEKNRREAPDDFINDETTTEESFDDDDDVLVQDSSDGDATWKPLKKKKADKKESDLLKDLDIIDVDADVPVRPEVTGLDPNWWLSLVPSSVEKQFEQSGKLVLLFEILRLSEEIGDKVLVFSQSLLTLDYIEDALDVINDAVERPNGDPQLKTIAGTGRFVRGTNYFRFDGSVNVHHRTRMCDKFNDPNNLDARLFLISTRAGGLGINLFAANRIVMLDASWNPSQDVQAIFRAYRFGQTKPCYVYRLVSQGTMEERIYERQVTKLSLSERVVDEKQIERHFLASDLQELYKFTPDRPDDDNPLPRETPVLPKDRVLAEMLEGKTRWIVNYHEHDSLLENLVSEQLTEEERKTAWDEYKAEKERGNATATEVAAAAVAAAAAAGGAGTAGPGPRSSQQQRLPDVGVQEIIRHIRGRLQQEQSLTEEELTRRTLQILQNVMSRSPHNPTAAATLLQSYQQQQQQLVQVQQPTQMPLAVRLPQRSDVRIAPMPYVQALTNLPGLGGMQLVSTPSAGASRLSQPQHVRPGSVPNMASSLPTGNVGYLVAGPAPRPLLVATSGDPSVTRATLPAPSGAPAPRPPPLQPRHQQEHLYGLQQHLSTAPGRQPNVVPMHHLTRSVTPRSLQPSQQPPQLDVATPLFTAGVSPNSDVAASSAATSGVDTLAGGGGSGASTSSEQPL